MKINDIHHPFKKFRQGSCHTCWWESNVLQCGNSMQYGGCTELQGRYQKLELAGALQDTTNYVASVLFQKRYYSLG